MISKTTKVVNNKFQVNFNFKPSNITHTRQNSRGTYKATHAGNGTTSRQGIWEGIEIVEVWTKIGDNAWRSHGTSSSVTVETSSNNIIVQGKAKYRLKTMGYHWNDLTGQYPFFWYGNVSSNPNKYRLGYFTDSKPSRPSNEHYYCVVPPDWTYVSCAWSDWAYKHANATKNWAIDKGRYEQRNGNYESASITNGWISESNLKQMWRKSMMFNFEKQYTTSVTSSGISTSPNTPSLTVPWAKGDKGKVTVKYTDNAGVAGKILLKAYCNNKTAEVLNYSNSWTFKNGESRTIDVDFFNAFGETNRGNDVYYEAWSKNNLGYECKTSTGRVGVQRYNGRPSIPTGLAIESDDNIIYNKIKFVWNVSKDPDNDTVVYDVWLKITSKEGQVLKDDYIAKGINSLSLNYDISNYPDEAMLSVKVRSNDSLITSDWCVPVEGAKGSVPKGSIVLLSPSVSETNLYNKRPRFIFDGYDESSEFIVVINNKEYSSIKNQSLFVKNKNKIMFKPNFDLEEKIKCYGYMKNEYGKSKSSMIYDFTIKKPLEDILEDNIITAKVVSDVQSLMVDFGKAFNKKMDYIPANKDMYITAETYNTCYKFLNTVANNINNLMPNSAFNYDLSCGPVEVGQLNDDLLWDKLVEELNYI